MIKVANILNRACCKECTGQRLTLVHLDTKHDISISNLDIEKDLRMMIRLKKGTNQSKTENELNQNKYRRIYDIFQRYT